MSLKTKRLTRKRRGAGFALALILALLCAPFVFGLSARGVAAADAADVYDFQNLLTPEQEADLAERFAQFREKNGYRIFLLTVGVNETGGYMDQDSIHAIEYFGETTINEPYIGLLINMDTRYFYIDIYGDEPLSDFTDAKQEKIEEAVIERLYTEDIYGAGTSFVQEADYQANYDPRARQLATGGAFSGAVGLIGSLGLVAGKTKKHREKAVAADADIYADPGSLNLALNRDQLSHQYVTRVARIRNNRVGGFGSGFGGGHTTTHGSFSGGSHSGGGGHF